MIQIQPPKLKSAVEMTALEMNQIHFDKKHTVLTPEVMRKI